MMNLSKYVCIRVCVCLHAMLTKEQNTVEETSQHKYNTVTATTKVVLVHAHTEEEVLRCHTCVNKERERQRTEGEM